MLLSLCIQSLLLSTALMIFTFIVAQYINITAIVDVAWGLGFALIAHVNFFKTNMYTPQHILATTLVCIWALRLTTHLYLRIQSKGEDPRYTKFRHTWGDNFTVRSFFQIFMLQAFLLVIIVYPLLVINNNTATNLHFLDFLGLLMWIFGFVFEAVGDYQLKKFISNPHNKGHAMQSGLWRYTRHPNYFGEITMWWGIFVIALSAPYGITAIISPITITVLILYASGIPMTEKLLEDNVEYQEYKKRTNALIPWWPKKIS